MNIVCKQFKKKGKTSCFILDEFLIYNFQESKMAKRLLDLSNEESHLRKKIKLENEMILDNIQNIDEDTNINQHEVETFLLIFHSWMQTVNSEEGLDEPDGAVTDAVLQIVLKISELLKNDFDSLKLPEFLKFALQKIKCLFNIQTEQNVKHADETEKANETAKDGGEEHRE